MIELLVVIAIIGILTSLVLPAVQAAREAARRAECKNHLKQCATAVLLHVDSHRHLPTGGWSKHWIGLPQRGYGAGQPGGWIYNVLPYLEQDNLRKLGGVGPAGSAEAAANAERIMTPLAVMNCPSRRRAGLFHNTKTSRYCDSVGEVARNDYAINGGHFPVRYGNGPDVLPVPAGFAWEDMSQVTGICYQRSRVPLAAVTDGTSNTYMLGEKHLRMDRYDTGDDEGDNENMYSGDDKDLLRFSGAWFETDYRPLPDSRTSPREGQVFGSAHADGFHVALCDGSVRIVSYAIQQAVHSRFAQRSDGQPTSSTD